MIIMLHGAFIVPPVDFLLLCINNWWSTSAAVGIQISHYRTRKSFWLIKYSVQSGEALTQIEGEIHSRIISLHLTSMVVASPQFIIFVQTTLWSQAREVCSIPGVKLSIIFAQVIEINFCLLTIREMRCLLWWATAMHYHTSTRRAWIKVIKGIKRYIKIMCIFN